MIEIIYSKELKKEVSQPQTPETKICSSTPSELCEKYNFSKEIYNYLLTVKKYCKYIIQLFNLYLVVLKERAKLKNLEDEDRNNKNFANCYNWNELPFAAVPEFGEVNVKEKLAINRIICGRAIFKEFEDISRIDIANKIFASKVKEIKTILNNLPPLGNLTKEAPYREAIRIESDTLGYFSDYTINLLEKILKECFVEKDSSSVQPTSIFALEKNMYSATKNLHLATNSEEQFKEYILEFKKLYDEIFGCLEEFKLHHMGSEQNATQSLKITTKKEKEHINPFKNQAKDELAKTLLENCPKVKKNYPHIFEILRKEFFYEESSVDKTKHNKRILLDENYKVRRSQDQKMIYSFFYSYYTKVKDFYELIEILFEPTYERKDYSHYISQNISHKKIENLKNFLTQKEKKYNFK